MALPEDSNCGSYKTRGTQRSDAAECLLRYIRVQDCFRSGENDSMHTDYLSLQRYQSRLKQCCLMITGAARRSAPLLLASPHTVYLQNGDTSLIPALDPRAGRS